MESLEIRTGCRLHFGLMELAAGQPLRFGGMGLMLEEPGFVLRFSARPSTKAIPNGEIQRRVAAQLERQRGRDRPERPMHVHLARTLPLHVGLGAGTQLAAAIAAGHRLATHRDKSNPLNSPEGRDVRDGADGDGDRRETDDQGARGAWKESTPPDGDALAAWRPIAVSHPGWTPRWLAERTGRGLRSAIGLHGFLHGGLVLDAGHDVAAPWTVAASAGASATGEFASEGREWTRSARAVSTRSTALPSDWRVVLVRPELGPALSGTKEAELLERIGGEPHRERDRMFALASDAMRRVEDGCDLACFAERLSAYMEFAGALFARYQGGLYNGPRTARAVELMRQTGLMGVGQSSWGPTTFGLAECEAQARSASAWLRARLPDAAVLVTRPAAHGAAWRPAMTSGSEE